MLTSSRLAVFATFFALAACGGHSGSGPGALSVSGSVSGLSSAGLVLADGSRSVTVASGATTFTFGSSYDPGSSYAVTVQTQPTGQVCTVANGNGTIGSANVGNVAVSCTSSSFHVGGTVSGLTAAGLVLANGTDTDTVASGATTFTLPGAVATTATYAVTVQTQPTGQVCSVANGSGTVAGADVANVVVTCADQGFQLGGSVSGLTTAGLVLADGSNTVTVPANATSFVLPTAVAVHSSYTIAVQSQPTGLACAVTHGSGTMPASNVTSVVVTCSSVPFTLGGTIQGLTTAGLVVANGADTVTVTANATSFTLPTPVDFGTAYTLTVQTQPTGLSCTFSNGGSATPSAGSMPAHNVTTVALVCAPQAYTVGGTVSGLTGTLVLANGSDSLSVSANGSFTMPASVAFGSTYTITVQTQPTGLTCSVGNATGTMPANDVTNVTVTCSVATYSISGTVTGLTSTGLVLQNNGTDDTTVSANATQFSMQTAVAYGSAYDITVLNQPSGQTCTITNGSGTANAAVTNVQIDCPHSVSFTTAGSSSWTVPVGVTSVNVTAYGGGGGSGGGPAFAAGGNGAKATLTLAVQPGDLVTIYVGGGGGAAQEGAGGGGLTYLDDGGSNIIIAGGGGGGGGGGAGDVVGAGGNAGSVGGAGGAGAGGAPGSGGSGGAAGASAVPSARATAGNAFTDLVTSGSGSGGVGGGGGPDADGGAGISNVVGNGGGGSGFYGAGGGGGGYGGGGGGGYGQPSGGAGASGSGGGGGGGSVGPAGTVIGVASAGGPGAGGTADGAGTDGAVIITYQ